MCKGVYPWNDSSRNVGEDKLVIIKAVKIQTNGTTIVLVWHQRTPSNECYHKHTHTRNAELIWHPFPTHVMRDKLLFASGRQSLPRGLDWCHWKLHTDRHHHAWPATTCARSNGVDAASRVERRLSTFPNGQWSKETWNVFFFFFNKVTKRVTPWTCINRSTRRLARTQSISLCVTKLHCYTTLSVPFSSDKLPVGGGKW